MLSAFIQCHLLPKDPADRYAGINIISSQMNRMPMRYKTMNSAVVPETLPAFFCSPPNGNALMGYMRTWCGRALKCDAVVWDDRRATTGRPYGWVESGGACRGWPCSCGVGWGWNGLQGRVVTCVGTAHMPLWIASPEKRDWLFLEINQFACYSNHVSFLYTPII